MHPTPAEEGTMSPQQKVLLTEGFEALGPERVTRGLQASGHSWRDCFLALATARQLEQYPRREHFVSTLFDVPVRVVNAVVRAWDHDEQAFRALVAEWLELNRAAVTTGAVVGA
ncbi:MAG: hypothetical protein DMD49_12250 [Gemmatimonadetes bacterium]|nr:MAG: hypothetical protein DMD49_12250 [Gemmatimonadota bacterium]